MLRPLNVYVNYLSVKLGKKLCIDSCNKNPPNLFCKLKVWQNAISRI